MTHQSVAQKLRQTREQKGIPLEKAHKTTRLRPEYIQALERGDLEALPSLAQARGYLRLYAGFLGLDAESLVAELDAPDAPPPAPEPALPETDSPPPHPEPQPEPTSEPAPAPEPESAPEPEPTPPAPQEIPLSTRIFFEVGETLRERRELLSLTHAELERHTRIRASAMQAMERGEFDTLPSPTTTRGMLGNYAQFLDLNAEVLLLRYAEGLQARLQERHPNVGHTPARRAPRFSLPNWARYIFSADLLVGGGMVVFLFLFTLWGAAQLMDLQQAEDLEPDLPSMQEALFSVDTPTPAPTPTLEGALSLPTAAPGLELPTLAPPTSPVAAPVQVLLSIVERVYLRVIVDGEVALDTRVSGGTVQTFSAQQSIEILIANAGAVQVTYNLQPIGFLGNSGQVVTRIFTPDGMIMPTATPTVPPTITPTPTITPSPTVTPTPDID
jgi:cytoskeleton protein RodZ